MFTVSVGRAASVKLVTVVVMLEARVPICTRVGWLSNSVSGSDPPPPPPLGGAFHKAFPAPSFPMKLVIRRSPAIDVGDVDVSLIPNQRTHGR